MPAHGHQFHCEIAKSAVSMDHVAVTIEDGATGETRTALRDRDWCVRYVDASQKGGNAFYAFLLETWNGGRKGLH